MQTQRAKARTVEQCEIYLDRIGQIMRRHGPNAVKLVPLVKRLKAELDDAKAEHELIEELLGRQNSSVKEIEV
jgi:hypothetical protein